MKRFALAILVMIGIFSTRLLGRSTGDTNVLQLSPFSMTVGHTPMIAARKGHLYFLDDYTNRLFICDLSGNIVRIIGEIGDAPGQFFKPDAMALSSHSVVIYDKGNSRVETFSLDGTFQNMFVVHGQIFSIAAGDDDLIYANDPSSGNLITVWDTNGHIVRTFGSFAKLSSLYRIPDRAKDEQLRSQSNLVRLAIGNSGQLYAAFIIAPVVREDSSDGRLIQEIRLTGGIVPLLTETLWNGVPEGGRLSYEVINGQQIPFLIKDIALDPDTHRLIVLTAFSTLFVIDPNGQKIRQLNIRGAFDWQLWKMAVEGNSIWFVRVFVPGAYHGELPS